MKPSKFIKNFIITAAVLLGLVIAAVVLVDPFFHYHAPWFGLKAVQTDKEYQVPGAIEHLDYRSLIVGSSVTENNNNSWYDSAFNTKTIKAVRSYGGTADLCWYLDRAYESHEIDYVFYNIDPASLQLDTSTTFELTGCPMYLYDRIPFNDYKYWLNKDVIFEKIPYMIARTMAGYDEGTSYNWWDDHIFSKSEALAHYDRADQQEILPEDYYAENCQANIDLLVGEAVSHPETEFYFFFPPYSVLWWDNSYRHGEQDAVLYDIEKTMSALVGLENVHLFNFEDEGEIVSNLDNYMDTLHFYPSINQAMCLQMAAETGIIDLGDDVTDNRTDSGTDNEAEWATDFGVSVKLTARELTSQADVDEFMNSLRKFVSAIR